MELLKELEKYESKNQRRWKKWVVCTELWDIADEQYDLFEAVDRKILLETINQCAMEVLGKVQFAVYEAVYIKGYNDDEVAEELKISKNNVWKTKNVVLKKLKNELRKRGII